MKTFLIAGSIVGTDSEKETYEDATPAQVNSFLKSLDENEDVTIEITSWGGDVAAGLAICNMIKKASAEGHKTTSHVIGVAASMASVIACACDNLQIDSNAFLMAHNPWTISMGNAEKFRKEAETLDAFRDAMLAIYRTKFVMSDELIKQMLDSETWIIGKDAKAFNLDCEIIPVEEPLKAVAKGMIPKFAKMPKSIKDLCMDKHEDLTTESKVDMKIETEEKTVEEEVQEAVEVQEMKEEAKDSETPVVEEIFTKAEVDKRVSGMQSAMAKQIDALKKDYDAKIADFEVQIKAKDEELAKAKADAISLKDSLEKANEELSEKTSALMEKENALATLNAGVNTPNEITDWKSLKGKAFFDWYAKNGNTVSVKR